jgi:N-carbamoyl-L-amino-acid hydrolase
MDSELIAHMPAAQLDENIMRVVETCASSLALSTTRLSSYAGHDAQIISRITPSGMIFIPSHNGISHNPREFTSWEDVCDGANVLLQAVLALAYGQPQLSQSIGSASSSDT